jgi:hypothetical protein
LHVTANLSVNASAADYDRRPRCGQFGVQHFHGTPKLGHGICKCAADADQIRPDSLCLKQEGRWLHVYSQVQDFEANAADQQSEEVLAEIMNVTRDSAQ